MPEKIISIALWSVNYRGERQVAGGGWWVGGGTAREGRRRKSPDQGEAIKF